MKLGLENKRVLVTGSTGGIGFASALSFAREGAEVWLNGRTQTRIDAAAEIIRAQVPGARVSGVAADVTTLDGIDAITAALPELDVLVNNFGLFEAKPFEEITDDDWRRHFEANVMSGVRLSRHYFPGMLARDWGRIVFVSSESAVQIPPDMIHYGMTKTAQLALARGLAERTAGTGVTVNTVLPGPTLTEGVQHLIDDMARGRGMDQSEVEAEFFRAMRPSSLLRRFARPEEAANLIVYVSSELATATNGAALRVDGGVVRAVL